LKGDDEESANLAASLVDICLILLMEQSGCFSVVHWVVRDRILEKAHGGGGQANSIIKVI
jgi:hypothetical protein